MRVAFFLTINNWWYDEITLTSKMKKTIYRHVPNINALTVLRIDYAVGYYLQYLMNKHKNCTIDLITPKEVIINKKFNPKEYELIITQFLSPLAVFQTYKEYKGEEYNTMLQKYSKKVYPPPKYTSFIEDKCAYSNLLKKHDILSPPQVCLTKKKYEESASKDVMLDKIHDKISNLSNAKEIFAKPILGTGAWGTKILKKDNTKQIDAYLVSMFKYKKYPKVMFQPYYPDFGVKYSEVRFIYIGDKHIATCTNKIDGSWNRPKQEVKTYGIDLPQYKTLKNISNYIINNIIKPKYFEDDLPMLETRIDFGCCLNQIPGYYFVNEIEYAGGVLTFMDKNQFNIHEHFAKQLVNVVKWYQG
jgi:hypothetical protein